MANEIAITSKLSIIRNGTTATGITNKNVSMTGSHKYANTQLIGTTYEAIDINDLTNIRYLYLYNPSTASIFVALHSASSSFATMEPTDTILISNSGSFTTYQVKSSAANTDVEVVAVER